MQIPLTLAVWLQSYQQCITAQNNVKQKDLISFFANISKSISATSDSFPNIHVTYKQAATLQPTVHCYILLNLKLGSQIVL